MDSWCASKAHGGAGHKCVMQDCECFEAEVGGLSQVHGLRRLLNETPISKTEDNEPKPTGPEQGTGSYEGKAVSWGTLQRRECSRV